MHIGLQTRMLIAVFFICLVIENPAISKPQVYRIFPYVQNVTTCSAVVMWKMSSPASGRLILKTADMHLRTYYVSKCKSAIIKITDLQPDTRYSYSVSIANKPELYNGRIWTMPQKPVSFRFAAYGDSRSSAINHSKVALAILKEKDIRLILHTGDMVNAGISRSAMAKSFFGPGSKLFRSIQVYPCIGNHDGGAVGLRDNFCLPGSGAYYSFKVSNCLFVIMNSLESISSVSKQYKWLLNTLKHTDAENIVIMLHHPPYSSGNHSGVNKQGQIKEKAIRDGRSIFPALAKRYPIRAVISGHDHAYERSVRNGVVYIVSGGGGAPLYGRANAKYNPYSKVFYSGLHYCIFDVTSGKIELTAKTPNGKVIDRYIISISRKEQQ